jgi:uncharacterized protein (DUF488 family)
MSDDTKKSFFRLLDGGGAKTPANDVELKVLTRRDSPPVQLGFPFIRASDKVLVSVGYDGLTLAHFEQLLTQYLPSSIIDIRVSPSFNNHSLTRDSVSEALRAFRVKYFHFADLANRFVGDSLDVRWSLEKYATALATKNSLAQVQELIEHGPVLLMSRPCEHQKSERSILINELKRRSASFEVVIHC